MGASLLLTGVLPRLPLFIVLIIGVVLVARVRAKVGSRSATLAHLGLGALFLDMVAGLIWSIALPTVYRSLDSSMSFNVVSTVVGLVQSILMAAGIALLVAAVVTRAAPGGGLPAGPAYGMPAPGYPAGPYSPQPHYAAPAQPASTPPYYSTPAQPATTNPTSQPLYATPAQPATTNPTSQPLYPAPAQPALNTPAVQPTVDVPSAQPPYQSSAQNAVSNPTGQPQYPMPGSGDSA